MRFAQGLAPARVLVSLAALVLFGLPPRAALAHGSGPFALALAVDRESDRLALTTTFGIFESKDGGQSWAFHCNESFGLHGPSQTVAPVPAPEDWFGVMLPAGEPIGVFSSAGVQWGNTDQCSWKSSLTTPLKHTLLDAAYVADGRDVWGVFHQTAAAVSFLYRFTDGAEELAFSPPEGVTLLRVHPAPASTNLVYASGSYNATGALALAVTSDAGKTWSMKSPPAQKEGFFSVLSVADDGTLFLSFTEESAPHEVWRSVDHGQTVERVLSLPLTESIAGFTFGDTPQTLFVAGRELRGPGATLYRSDDGGRTFDSGTSGGPGYRCLGYSNGKLFACADSTDSSTPFALGVSRDLGETWEPAINFAATLPTASCASSTCERAAAWVRDYYYFVPPEVPDAGADAGGTEVGELLPEPKDDAGSCRVSAAGRHTPPASAVAALVAASLAALGRMRLRMRRTNESTRRERCADATGFRNRRANRDPCSPRSRCRAGPRNPRVAR